MRPDELASLIDRRLAQLPAPRAPSTLLPRVLLGVRREIQRPGYGRHWLKWPWPYQAGSAIVLVALAFLMSMAVEWVPRGGVPNFVHASQLYHDFSVLASGAYVLWRVFLEPTLDYLVVLSGLMCVAVALFCAALSQVLKIGDVNQ